ncbi:MAG: CBS domain-containing protein [Candidatus Dadabacteria bacterium]|nr:CBS domain-containing protein [Candidatus Dadabacteria bacterium]NIS08698.1 CBS domain-containing protein [Candidatus Dadabacteria bacterium]NIV42180.1 CBS domain-containing protein [Candidatus Dadabacteria bacterium]NIX15384.1 CBS domain-containing protein [Candidatus Dadabacteria bacterium]NIY22047.1 CBS domain-containing protein [Candidatus Dadabacteria bacterium]
MNTVSDILQSKGTGICTISPNATVYEGLQIMAEKDVGAVLITQNNKLLGIFTERDYARKVILQGKSSLNTAIKELMVTDLLFVKPSDSIDQCMAIMTEKQIRHLPVMQGDELLGLVSMRDVISHIISHKNFKIKQLEKYITGSY